MMLNILNNLYIFSSERTTYLFQTEFFPFPTSDSNESIFGLISFQVKLYLNKTT